MEKKDAEDGLKKAAEELKKSVDEYNKLKDVRYFFAEWEKSFDEAVANFTYDPTVRELINEMKGKYKERLLTEAATRRSKPEK